MRGVHVSVSLSSYLHIMAPHTGITTWSLAGSDHVISPAGSSAPSIVAVDSILSDTHKKSQGTLQTTESPIRSQAIESLGNSGKYPGVDDSFIRHPKYFFADGNITFLVRGCSDDHGRYTRFNG
jgi:hypothetical protein